MLSLRMLRSTVIAGTCQAASPGGQPAGPGPPCAVAEFSFPEQEIPSAGSSPGARWCGGGMLWEGAASCLTLHQPWQAVFPYWGSRARQ